MGLADCDWYQDEIRKREAWPHPLSGGRRANRRRRAGSLPVIVTWCLVFAVAVGGSYRLNAWWKARHRPPIEAQPAPPPVVDLFKDDPTWHTGPRPVAEPTQAIVLPETREVAKCIVNGRASYGQGDCAGGTRAVIPIAAGPTYEQQQEAEARAASLAERAAAVDRRLAWEEAHRARTTARVSPSGDLKAAECAALDGAIHGLDAQARQPHGGSMQDWIKDERLKARSRQYALRC